ncbi:MAG: ATP-binding cassette domain-containing protein [Muribaculaceae bacterium]|nr:ATP-binding cassette domain-containing protein [Muribaculaceae bacterium]
MDLLASHIKKAFGDNSVLTDVSLTLTAGKVSVLMGTNGAGKTTLLNILSGFMKPDGGSIKLDGKEILSIRPSTIANLGIRRTFQDMRLIGEMTVLENVLLAFPGQVGEKWWKALLPLPKIAAEQKANTDKAKLILEQCFIDDIMANRAKDISYGQQKLLNLACCLAGDSLVWLLDEPVAGVNSANREKLTHVIQDQKASGKSILIIEHNSDFIESVADEILFLNKGVISNYPSYNAFRNDMSVKNAYV